MAADRQARVCQTLPCQAAMFDGVLSASAFVFPHAADDAVGEVSLVGAACLAACLTFAEFAVDDYFADWVRRREQRVKRNTRHASGQRNRLYVRPVIGRIPLNKITRGHIEQIHANVAAAGLSPATLRAAHAVDEQQQFRQFIAGDPLEHLLVFLLGSGLRRGEALGLAWSDITFSDRGATIRVGRSWTVSGTGSPFATTPKNSRQRVVPIGTHTAAAHHRQKADQNSDRLMVGAGWATATRRLPDGAPDDLVFTDPGGMPWHPQAVTRRFAVLGKNCSPKVERITLHGTRHSHAVTALRAGIDAKVVSERLGHASVSFTLDKYGSAMPEHHEAAVDVFEAAAYREAG